MNINNLLIRGGYREYKKCLIWDLPSDEEPRLDINLARKLLTDSGCLMLHNVYDWDCKEETNFWEIICDKGYEIQDLPSKTRNMVRRSLKDCDIRIISNIELIEDNGYDVLDKAYIRYKDKNCNPISRPTWEEAIRNDLKSEFWGVYIKETGKLIAYSKNSIGGLRVNYASMKSIPEYMNKHYPNYGLLYEMTRYYLKERKYRYVTDGYRSITEHSGIQDFLIKRFLFRKAYCRLTIYYKWWFGIAVRLLYPFRSFINIAPISHVLKYDALTRE